MGQDMMSAPGRPASVLIVEDDARFRDAFADVVLAAPDLCLAGVAADLCGGLRLLHALAPDVALVEVGLPDGSGIEVIRQAQRHHPGCEVMVVTVFAEEQLVLACIAAGATGYLLKETRGMDIAAQIRLLLDGGSPITPSVARRLLGHLGPRGPMTATAKETPSPQEQAVLQLCAKGYNCVELAQLLALSRHTVETYIKRIYRKLRVHSKTEAVYEGRKLGFVAD